jgi:hypothetical protein
MGGKSFERVKWSSLMKLHNDANWLARHTTIALD